MWLLLAVPIRSAASLLAAPVPLLTLNNDCTALPCLAPLRLPADSKTGKVVNEFGATRFDVAVRGARRLSPVQFGCFRAPPRPLAHKVAWCPPLPVLPPSSPLVCCPAASILSSPHPPSSYLLSASLVLSHGEVEEGKEVQEGGGGGGEGGAGGGEEEGKGKEGDYPPSPTIFSSLNTNNNNVYEKYYNHSSIH